MPNKILTTLFATIISVSLVGCETASKQDTGAVVGGVLGGVLGSQVGSGSGQTAATIAGVLIGGYIGGNIGKTMDENDRLRARDALESNPTNQPSAWTNPDSGNAYTVTPTKTYNSAEGTPCREYTTEVVIDGRRETAKGTACRENGAWRIIN